MNDQTGKRKTAIFCILLAGLVLAAALLFDDYRKSPGQAVMEGHYLFDGKNPFTYETILTGDWEFYPDVLYYSDPQKERPDPCFVQLPDRWIGTTDHEIPRGGNASYRLIIDEYVPFAGKSNIVLSMMGFLQDYKIFINGRQANVRIPSPTGYPIYAIDAEGTVEIVIELRNSTTGLSMAPGIWAVGVHIGRIDTMRNFLFIAITLFLILFVMFLVFSFSPEAHRLRPLLVLGFLMTASFACHTVWISGYLDSVDRRIGGTGMMLICIFFRFMTIGTGIMDFRIFCPFVFSRKQMILCEGLLTAGWLINVILVFGMHRYNGWFAVYILTAFSIMIWLYSVFKCFRKRKGNILLLPVVLLFLFTADAVSFWSDWVPDRLILRNVWPAAIISLILLCFVNYYRYQKAALVRARELLEIERYARKTQTAMLASQIQPHFLYNTLLTIQELCRFDPEEASRVIVRFSDYLRHNIDFMNYAELTPFEDEEKHIDNFIYIQKARFEDKLQYDADIQVRDFLIPPLTVQPLVENAVKYGVRGRIEGGFVHLKVYEDSEGIHIIVENSGPGFDAEHVRTDHSIGNIRERMKTLLNAELMIRSREGQEGTKVEILIPERMYCTEEREVSFYSDQH